MSFTSWLHNVRSVLVPARVDRKHRRQRPLRAAAYRPRLELLEDRCVPAMYAVTDLGTLGGYSSNAEDLNQVGQVVGSARTADEHYAHAFVWENGTMTDLGTLGGSSSDAYGINDLGQVVGIADLPGDEGFHAFLVNPQGGVWFQDSDLDGRNDFMMDLGILNGSTFSFATDINNAGQVVGYGNNGVVGTSTGRGRAFLWDATNGMTDLGTPLGFTESWARSINNAGQVTGSAVYSDPLSGSNYYSAFLWDAANGMTALGAGPTYTDSEAMGLNDAGQVVGDQWNASATLNPAFLWSPDSPNGLNGSFTDLGMLPDAVVSSANDLNNAGTVVGFSITGETVLVEHTVLVEQTVLVEYTVLVEDPYVPCSPGCVCIDDPTYHYETYSYYETTYVYETTYSYETYYDVSHAFLWDAAGGMVDLQNQLLPGSDWTLRDALAINDGGSIAVNGYSWGGGAHALLLTPIPPGTPSINITDAPAVTEDNVGAVEATFTVTLSVRSDQTVTVDFATAAGSAAGSDFVPSSGTLTFLPGETSKPITVQVRGDLLNEDTEYFTVNLSNPTSAFINVGQGTGTILDDDPLPTLAVNDVQVTEGNSGTTNAVFSVSLSAPSGRSVSVYYSTSNDTAAAGSDYQYQSGWLTFAPGQLSQTVTIVVNGDTLNEADETFSVNLSSPTNATLADAEGLGSILNDDPVPSLAISDVTLNEGNTGTTSFVFRVSLSAVSGQPVAVNFTTADGTATGGSDYVAASGTLTIPAGQLSGTIIVQVNGDRLAEPNETFFINLSNPVNAGIADGQGAVTIVDDEPRISITDVSVFEGSSASRKLVFTVTLSSAYDQAVTVNFATSNGTATTADHDYQAQSGTLTFAPGETTKTITILVYGDKKKESNEIFYVDLFDNSSNSVISKKRGTGMITDDD